MNPIIKIGNLQHLKVLEQLLLSTVEVKDEKINTVKPPFFNLMEIIVAIYQEYCRCKDNNLHVFILNFFKEKHKSSFQFYRHMSGFIIMWKKYVETHEQARLMLSLLSSERSSKQSVKLFLKIRKSILKNIHSKIMQEILLNHQDMISIAHLIFSQEMKRYSTKKIQELFISLRKKSTFTDKINGAVVCEFFMNCAEKFQRQELDNIKDYYEEGTQEQKHISQNYVKQRVFKPLQFEQFGHDTLRFEHQLSNKQIESEIQQQSIPKFKESTASKTNFKHNFIMENIYNKMNPRDPLEDAKEIVNKRYSNSWQKLLKTNKEMKQKLLRNHQQNQ